jgi:alanine dehydrogenase
MHVVGTTRIFTNDDVVGGMSPVAAVARMTDLFRDLEEGRFASPRRLWSDLGVTKVSFSFGGYTDRGVGYRITSFNNVEPITITYRPDGTVELIVLGDQFLGLRAGAIGGAAVDALARPDASKVAIIGSGRNGWWHVWAVTGVRDVTELRVFSRDPRRREAFASHARAELGLNAFAVDSAKAAVEEADVVILSTDSAEAVIDPSWVKAGAHVSSFGPKSATEHECPPELVERTSIVVTDIPEHLRTAGPLFPEPAGTQVVSLGSIITGAAPGRVSNDDITLFLLTGLGGTETVLAQLLAAPSLA